jgi:hypothetical protein
VNVPTQDVINQMDEVYRRTAVDHRHEEGFVVGVDQTTCEQSIFWAPPGSDAHLPSIAYTNLSNSIMRMRKYGFSPNYTVHSHPAQVAPDGRRGTVGTPSGTGANDTDGDVPYQRNLETHGSIDVQESVVLGWPSGTTRETANNSNPLYPSTTVKDKEVLNLIIIPIKKQFHGLIPQTKEDEILNFIRDCVSGQHKLVFYADS